jgi:hypothetical protein
MKTGLQQEYERRRNIVMNNGFMRWCVEKKLCDIHDAYYLLNDPYPNAVALRKEYRKETGKDC